MAVTYAQFLRMAGLRSVLAGLPPPAYVRRVKMILDIPAPLAKRFKAAVPGSQRSAVVTRLLERAFREKRQCDEAVCRRVNRLTTLSAEMAEWERFDDTDPA